MRALLASPLGFLIGLSLGTLGGGGSILAVPALVYVAGQAPAAATATSLLVVGAAAAFGVVGHWRAGRVRVRAGAAFGAAGIGGSLAGTLLNDRMDPDALLLGFSGLVLVAAWRMLAARPAPEQPVPAGSGATTTTVRSRLGMPMRLLAAGTGVGFLTGLFGVGGGFVIVPALTLVLRFPMAQAVGTSLLIIAINSAIALTARLGTTGVEWSVALPFAASAVAGVVTGSSLAGRLPARTMTRWFAGLLVAVGLYTATSSLVALW